VNGVVKTKNFPILGSILAQLQDSGHVRRIEK